MQEGELLPQPRGAPQAAWDVVAVGRTYEESDDSGGQFLVAPLPRLNARSDSPEARNELAELVSNSGVLREVCTPFATDNPEATRFEGDCILLREIVPHHAQGTLADN